MKIRKELLKREVGGESFLLPETTTEKQILAEYEVDEDTARKDLEEFLEKLRDMGII